MGEKKPISKRLFYEERVNRNQVGWKEKGGGSNADVTVIKASGITRIHKI